MSFLDMVFGCSHKNLSFPITVRGARSRNMAASVTGTYVVCLSCGREFAYDWNQMRVVRDSSAASPPRAMTTEPRRAA